MYLSNATFSKELENWDKDNIICVSELESKICVPLF